MGLSVRALQRVIILEVLLRLLECGRCRADERGATAHAELDGGPVVAPLVAFQYTTSLLLM